MYFHEIYSFYLFLFTLCLEHHIGLFCTGVFCPVEICTAFHIGPHHRTWLYPASTPGKVPVNHPLPSSPPLKLTIPGLWIENRINMIGSANLGQLRQMPSAHSGLFLNTCLRWLSGNHGTIFLVWAKSDLNSWSVKSGPVQSTKVL